MAEEVKFCPLLTVVKAGQPSYIVCQTTCVFFLDGECAFITTAKALKEIKISRLTDIAQKDKKDRS